MKNGYGKEIMSDNSSYQGNFLNNKKHGKGVYK